MVDYLPIFNNIATHLAGGSITGINIVSYLFPLLAVIKGSGFWVSLCLVVLLCSLCLDCLCQLRLPIVVLLGSPLLLMHDPMLLAVPFRNWHYLVAQWLPTLVYLLLLSLVQNGKSLSLTSPFNFVLSELTVASLSCGDESLDASLCGLVDRR